MNRESVKLREHGPERRGGQGLDSHQYDSGDATILALLAESPAADNVDLAITWRADAYEVWSRRGMVRFKRFADERGALSFEVVEQIGENPIANQDPFIVSTIDEELEAAGRSGNRTDDPNRAWFEPYVLSHPYAYERIAQLFDSPRAPDVVVSPKAYAWGIQPGQHGALDVVQCRAPLVFSGPGVRRGTVQAERPPGRRGSDHRADRRDFRKSPAATRRDRPPKYISSVRTAVRSTKLSTLPQRRRSACI